MDERFIGFVLMILGLMFLFAKNKRIKAAGSLLAAIGAFLVMDRMRQQGRLDTWYFVFMGLIIILQLAYFSVNIFKKKPDLSKSSSEDDEDDT